MEWTKEAIITAAREFEETAINGNGIFHNGLAREYP